MSYGVVIDTERLQRARLRRGWSLRDVANRSEELGMRIDHGNYARYERGELRPTPRTLLAIAKTFDLEVDDLLPRTKTTRKGAA